MDELINYLRQFGGITPDEANFIRLKGRVVILRRGEILLEANEVPQEITFLASGVLSASTCKRGFDDVIRYFIEERKFVPDIDGFLQQRPVNECIQAVIDSRLMAFPLEAMHQFTTTLRNWNYMAASLSVNGLLEMVNKRAPITGGDAVMRILEFENRYPGLALRIPQSVVASYLGLAPPTVSRIRNRRKGQVREG